jgi:hypothetical protein
MLIWVLMFFSTFYSYSTIYCTSGTRYLLNPAFFDEKVNSLGIFKSFRSGISISYLYFMWA